MFYNYHVFFSDGVENREEKSFFVLQLSCFFSDGVENSEEKSLEEGTFFRPVRSADPERRNKKVEKQKKKGKRNLKNKKKNKKHGREGKVKNGRKGSNGKVRKNSDKSKNQKAKKHNKRKDRKRGAQNPKKMEKKNKKNLKGKERLFGSTEACGTDVTKALACHDAAVDYFKLLKGKVGQTRAQNVQKS